MRLSRRTNIRRFFALLTILSFTLTQTPAWALRPGIENKTPQGLEEVLKKEGSPQATVASLAVPSVNTVSVRGVGSPVIAGVLQRLSQLPSQRQNTRDMVLEAIEILRAEAPELAATIPSRETVAQQLDNLIANSPALDCPICGATLAHSLLSDVFVDPERQLPEQLQSPEFQQAEVLNALLLALSIAHQGRLVTMRSRDGHLMPASTAADLRDLLTLMEAHPGFPQEASHGWVGARMTQAQLERALNAGQTLVLHVGGNHFVEVTSVADGRVEYTDPQIRSADGLPGPAVASRSTRDFLEWWKGDARANTTGVALVGLGPGQQLEAQKPLSDKELAEFQGCCGINATFAHFRSVRKILDAVLRLKYRAPDDTGILVLTGEEGLKVRKVQGAPDALILEMIDDPLFPETLAFPENAETNRAAIAQYRRERRALLIDEGLQNSGWVTPPEEPNPGIYLNELYDRSIEGLYQGNYTIGMGCVGGLFSGWVYTLGNSADQYQMLNGPASDLADLISRWDLTPEFIKLFIRHRLMQELPQQPDDPTRVAVLADFDRLGDRAVKQALDKDEQGEWDRIWNQYLRGKTIRIPPDFNRDPVRHVFHLLDQIVGSFREHPEWEQQIQALFEQRRPPGKANWNWRTYWRNEFRYNMPGHACAVLVEWFQDFAAQRGLVPGSVHQAWIDRRREQQHSRRGFSEGTVDLPLLLILPEVVLGHGRWAMTGDPKWWNGHPQVTTSRAVVHNGAVEADKNNELKREHEARYQALMTQAAALRAAQLFDGAVLAQAAAIEQAARWDYSRFEGPSENQVIVTDTRTIVRQWQLMADDYRADLAAGLVLPNGLIDMTKPGRLNRVGQEYEGRPVFDRAAAWNLVVQNLRQYWSIQDPNPDEVAHRVAMMEMAPGSGIATDGVSLATPLTEFVTSHDRPVDIVIRQEKDHDGRVLYEDYMVTSDSAAGIGLFPAPGVNAAARRIANSEERAMAAIDAARGELADHRITRSQFDARVREEISRLQRELDTIIKGERVTETVGGQPVERRRGGFHVKVYHLKGAERHAVITRRLDKEGRQVVDVRISKFNGEPLDPEDVSLKLNDETVNPALGDRGRFQSFMEKHIAEIPLILLKQVLRYIGMRDGQPVVTMDTVFRAGVTPTIVQDEQGLHTRLDSATEDAIERPGINSGVIERHFGPGLEENKLPNLRRVILVGVGSSWRDAKIVQAIFQELLPGVKVEVYDPVEVTNEGKLEEFDPKTDLVVGMSWSGTTDSMVRLFNAFEESGFCTIAVTGKPPSDMGRIGRKSGGTIDVLSGDESTVATTKGFESVLYSLGLLAVQLSQLQGNPALENTRRGYVEDSRRVADLVYDVLAERDKPKGSRVLDLNDRDSLVNRLGRRYKERRKLLWVGSRNMPIHVEGELKGEEIVSSKDKPSMVGIAADIEDSSWQATVTHNMDPRAAEQDKAIVGFDMCDPTRYEAFMTEIRQMAAAGVDFVVITYDATGNPYYEELEALAAQHPGRIDLITVPQIRPTLQPAINALVYFRFSAAVAKERGLTAAEMDNSRNLAKSVTVSYAQALKELLLTTKTKVITMLQQATQWLSEMAKRFVQHLQVLRRGVWDSMTNNRLRAIQRLPMVLERAYQACLGPGSWLTGGPDRERMERVFGPKAQGIKRIVIVTDEEGTEYASQACQTPLGSVEVIFSGTGEGAIYDPANKRVAVPIKGVYYRVSFDRATGSYRLRFDPALPQNKGLPNPATADFTVTPQTTEVTVNGYQYSIDASSFSRDRKKPENLAFGLSMRAVLPDLLGVKVEVFRASDQALDRELDQKDTLFVLVSRSNNRHQQNHQIPPVSGKPEDERTATDLAALSGIPTRPETAMVNRVEQLQARGGRFISLCDPKSAIFQLGQQAGLGVVPLPADTDDTSLYSLTYMGLLSIGVKLGALRGIDTQVYQKALSTVPGLVAGVLRNPELRKRAERFISRFGNYKKIHIIGGGQAYADAKEYARILRSLGIFAEAQLNDSAWHGPLAAIDPSRFKFADQDKRTGINPQFDPSNDALVFILMTDKRFFNTALGGDAQVYDSRNARFALIIKESDRELDAVQKVGAAEDGIFALADFPDELGNFANAAAAQFLAALFAGAHAKALGRDILPPPGGVAPAGESPLVREIKPTLTPIFQPFAAQVAQVVEGMRATGDPQFLVVQDPSNAGCSFLFLNAQDREGLLGDVTRVLSTTRVDGQRFNLMESLSPNPVGAAGVMCFRLNQPSARVEQIQDRIRAVMAVPPVIVFPGIPEPTPGQRLDMVGVPLTQATAAIAVRAHQSGLVGAATREGITGRYADLPPGQRTRLEELARYVAQGWAPRQIQEVASEYRMVAREINGRTGVLTLAAHPGGDILANAVENVKSDLTDRYGKAAGESGAMSYVVYGPGLYDLGDPARVPQDLYARMCAFYVPPDRRSQFQTINPLMSVSEIEPFLRAVAAANGRPLSKVRVVTLPGRERDRFYNAELARLAAANQIQLTTPQDGTVEWALRANMPPATAEDEIVVVMATARLPQAVASVGLSAGMPEGAFVTCRLLPDADTLAQRVDSATPEVPIGGAATFTAEQRAVVTRWVGKGDRAGALLSGQPISTADVRQPVNGVLVPHTSLVSMPIPVSGVTPVSGTNQVALSPVRVQDHLFWVQPQVVELAAELPPGAEFRPPQIGTMGISSAEVSLRVQFGPMFSASGQEVDLDALVAGYGVYVTLRPSAQGQVPVHTEIMEVPGSVNTCRLLIVAPYRLDAGRRIGQLLQARGIPVTNMFVDAFQESAEAQRVSVAIVDVTANPTVVREQDIPAGIQAAFQPGLEEGGSPRRGILRRAAAGLLTVGASLLILLGSQRDISPPAVQAQQPSIPLALGAAGLAPAQNPVPEATGALAPLRKRLGNDRSLELIVWDARDALKLKDFFELAVKAGFDTVWISGYRFNQMDDADQKALLKLASDAKLKRLGIIDGNYDWPQNKRFVEGLYDKLTTSLGTHHKAGRLGEMEVVVGTDVEEHTVPLADIRAGRAKPWDLDRGPTRDLTRKTIMPLLTDFAKNNKGIMSEVKLTEWRPFWLINDHVPDASPRLVKGAKIKGVEFDDDVVVAVMSYRDDPDALVKVLAPTLGAVKDAKRKFKYGFETVTEARGTTYNGKEIKIGTDGVKVLDALAKDEEVLVAGNFVHTSSVVAAHRMLGNMIKAKPAEEEKPAAAADKFGVKGNKAEKVTAKSITITFDLTKEMAGKKLVAVPLAGVKNDLWYVQPLANGSKLFGIGPSGKVTVEAHEKASFTGEGRYAAMVVMERANAPDFFKRYGEKGLPRLSANDKYLGIVTVDSEGTATVVESLKAPGLEEGRAALPPNPEEERADAFAWGVIWNWVHDVLGSPKAVSLSDFYRIMEERNLSDKGARAAMMDAGYRTENYSGPEMKGAPGFAWVKQGLEELQEGVHYRVDPDGIRMIRSVRVAKPVTLSVNQEGIITTITIGVGTLLLDQALFRGNITIGENSEIGGIITRYAKIGNNVRSHRGTNIRFAEIGDNVHMNAVTVRGYGTGPEELVVLEGGPVVTLIENTVLETVPDKKPWSFVSEDAAPNPAAQTLARYGVNQRRTEVAAGAIIRGARFIINTRIEAGVTIPAGCLLVEHSVVDKEANLRSGANITRSYIGKKADIGSEVSKSWLGDGFKSEHQASYLSLIAPNEILIVNAAGELTTIPSVNSTNIGAGTVFANYGGTQNALGKSLKGTAFVFAGFTGVNSNVINRYDHPDVPATELPTQRELTILYPFTLTKGQVTGTVFPFTLAEGGPKTHQIGWVLEKYPGLIRAHLKRGTNPEAVEGAIRLGLYLIQRERQIPPDSPQRRWTDAQLNEGERIYQAALDSGQWSPQALATQAAGQEEALVVLANHLQLTGLSAQSQLLEEMVAAGVNSLPTLQQFLTSRHVPDGLLSDQARRSLLDLIDNYQGLHEVFAQNLGFDRAQTISFIQREAAANGLSFVAVVRGVLDVPDAQLPQDAEFDLIVRGAEALFNSGGNSGRSLREGARVAGVSAISTAPVDDDGGNYGTWRTYLMNLFNQFIVSLGGDVANQRTVEASLVARQAMADRLPEKPKTGWPAGSTARSLLIAEIKNALDSFKKQYPTIDLATTTDPRVIESLVSSLATLISTHRILSQAFPDLMDVKVLSKASGQNASAVAIGVRSGFIDPTTKQVNPAALKRACLLWNQALGLRGTEAGLVVPNSLDGTRLYFVYADDLTGMGQAAPVLDTQHAIQAIKLGDNSDIAPKDFFTVTKNATGDLILTDGLGRQLTYDAGEQAFVGAAGARFEAFPDRIRRAISDRLDQVQAVSIVRGEDHASEVDSLYDSTQVIAWGAEFKVGQEPHVSPVTQEIYNAILAGQSPVRIVTFGPGSEGTSLAPHQWRRETVEFLAQLAQRRRAGQSVPRVAFVFNPSETNDSYNLGPLGVIRNLELIFRQILNDDSITFQDLIPEIVLFDHTDPWVLARNSVVAQEMYPDEPLAAALEKVDYLHILGPTDAEKQTGKKHGLVKRNRQPMPLDAAIRAELESRFGAANVRVGPYADVRGTVESSRGKISRAPHVLALTHRLGIVLFPERRATLLPVAVQAEQRIYREKHNGQDPTPEALAEFLTRVGYNTNAAEVQPLMGLEEGRVAEQVVPETETLMPEKEPDVVGIAPEVKLPAAPIPILPVNGQLVGPPVETATRLVSPVVATQVGKPAETITVGNLLEQRGRLGQETATVSGVGVIAGPNETGLAYGTALSTVVDAAGNAIPVALIVNSIDEADLARRLAPSAKIFIVGTPEMPTPEDAVTRAQGWLAQQQVSRVIPIGTPNNPVTALIERMLETAFGIRLGPESIVVWQGFVRDATLAFQA